MEDISRSASAEGSFGAGELNELRRADWAFEKNVSLAALDFAVSFHAIPALQERDMCILETELMEFL